MGPAWLVLALAACGEDAPPAPRPTGEGAAEAPRLVLLSPAPDALVDAGHDLPLVVHLAHPPTPEAALALSWRDAAGAPLPCTPVRTCDVETCTLSPGPEPGDQVVDLRLTGLGGAATTARWRFRVIPAPVDDADGDGYPDAATGGTDCDDEDAGVHPGAPEACDGRDEDCDGIADESVSSPWYADLDGDGAGDPGTWTNACAAPPGHVDQAGDCDDDDPDRHPGVTERCNGLDDDCDGDVDEDAGAGWWADADGDGHGDPRVPLAACEPAVGGAPDDADCADDDPTRQGCRSCAELQATDAAAGDGPATLLDRDGAPYTATCLQSREGGGWTLVATNAWDGAWGLVDLLDATPLGPPSTTTSYKAPAWAAAPFRDLLFENGLMFARYDGIGDGTQSWWAFSASVPPGNCGEEDGLAWPLAAGDLAAPGLCDPELRFHPRSWRDGACAAGPAADGWGPTWSAAATSADCPLPAAAGSGLLDTPWGLSPWGTATPLRMWVR